MSNMLQVIEQQQDAENWLIAQMLNGRLFKLDKYLKGTRYRLIEIEIYDNKVIRSISVGYGTYPWEAIYDASKKDGL